MYFHPLDEYTYYHWGCVNNQRRGDRSASHFGRFAPQSRPLGCAICRPLFHFIPFRSICQAKPYKITLKPIKIGPKPILQVLFESVTSFFEFHSQQNLLLPHPVQLPPLFFCFLRFQSVCTTVFAIPYMLFHLDPYSCSSLCPPIKLISLIITHYVIYGII